MRRPSEILTEAQTTFVEAKMQGMNDYQAGLAAGQKSPSSLVTSKTVIEALKRAREKLQDVTQIKRVDIVLGLMDGIEMARMIGDPANVIRGWTEIGKLLGLYAPEEKKITLTNDQQRARSKLESLTDEELLELSQGKQIIEGEIVGVENS